MIKLTNILTEAKEVKIYVQKGKKPPKGRKLSKEHRNKLIGNKNASGRDSRFIKSCKQCKIKYKTYNKNSKFCCINCRNIFVHNKNLKEINCKYCGNIFQTKRNIFCSKSCASKSHTKFKEQ